jgi:hypothetical protein
VREEIDRYFNFSGAGGCIKDNSLHPREIFYLSRFRREKLDIIRSVDLIVIDEITIERSADFSEIQIFQPLNFGSFSVCFTISTKSLIFRKLSGESP